MDRLLPSTAFISVDETSPSTSAVLYLIGNVSRCQVKPGFPRCVMP